MYTNIFYYALCRIYFAFPCGKLTEDMAGIISKLYNIRECVLSMIYQGNSQRCVHTIKLMDNKCLNAKCQCSSLMCKIWFSSIMCSEIVRALDRRSCSPGGRRRRHGGPGGQHE